MDRPAYRGDLQKSVPVRGVRFGQGLRVSAPERSREERESAMAGSDPCLMRRTPEPGSLRVE